MSPSIDPAITGGLSRFSRRENGTVPFPNSDSPAERMDYSRLRPEPAGGAIRPRSESPHCAPAATRGSPVLRQISIDRLGTSGGLSAAAGTGAGKLPLAPALRARLGRSHQEPPRTTLRSPFSSPIRRTRHSTLNDETVTSTPTHNQRGRVKALQHATCWQGRAVHTMIYGSPKRQSNRRNLWKSACRP